MAAEDVVPESLDEMGPIDFVVVEFFQDKGTGEGFEILLELVDRGLIRVLDLVFLHKGDDGTVTVVPPSQLPIEGGFDASVFDGASSGLLGRGDLEAVGAVIDPGRFAGVLVYENAWAGPFGAALRRGGAQLVADGRIPVQAVLAALDAPDA